MKNIEIDIKEVAKYERLERLIRLATPKGVDTPQSCTSGDLKKCIPNDLLNKIEESSPVKSRIPIEEIEEELIAHDLRFDESSDNIIIDMQNDFGSLSVQESKEFESCTPKILPNTHSYFYPSNQQYKFLNQYSSHPNQIGFHNNGIQPINPNVYFRHNSSECNLHSFSSNPVTQNSNFNNMALLQNIPQINNNDEEFTKLFKMNDYKNEEIKNLSHEQASIKEKLQTGKNIIKKTINNQDISGWICVQCKNFNYEMRTKCNRCALRKCDNDLEVSKKEELKKKQKAALAKAAANLKEDKNKKNSGDRVGDWVCIKCKNNNFSFRVVCNRCQLSKTESDKLFDIHMKNIIQIGKVNESIQNQLNFEHNQQMYNLNILNNIYQNQMNIMPQANCHTQMYLFQNL